ncbi:hypothetical protein [Thalassobacter stenotrophicus]|nr:hypothetical protein [Thalassobacter stenotrophicus]
MDWEVHRQLADEAIAAVGEAETKDALSASKRRVRGILEHSAAA